MSGIAVHPGTLTNSNKSIHTAGEEAARPAVPAQSTARKNTHDTSHGDENRPGKKRKLSEPRNQDELHKSFSEQSAKVPTSQPAAPASAAGVAPAAGTATARISAMRLSPERIENLMRRYLNFQDLNALNRKILEEAGRLRNDPEFAAIADPFKYSLEDPKRWQADMIFTERLEAAYATLTEPLPPDQAKLKKLCDQRTQAKQENRELFEETKEIDPEYYAAVMVKSTAYHAIQDLMRLDKSKAHSMVEKFSSEPSLSDSAHPSTSPVAGQVPAIMIDAISYLIEANKPSFPADAEGTDAAAIQEMLLPTRAERAESENRDPATDTEDQKSVVKKYDDQQRQLQTIRDLAQAARLSRQKQADTKADEPVREAA